MTARPFRPSRTQRAVLALCRRPTTTDLLCHAIRPEGAVVLNRSGLARSMKALVARGLLEVVEHATFREHLTTAAGLALLEALNAGRRGGAL